VLPPTADVASAPIDQTGTPRFYLLMDRSMPKKMNNVTDQNSPTPAASVSLSGVATGTSEAFASTLIVNKETWRDWMVEGMEEPAKEDLLTRAQFLANLKRFHGVSLTEASLVEWERAGLLPRPVRERHGDATYALYPWWVAHLVTFIRERQEAGWSKAEIKDYIDNYIRKDLTLRAFVRERTKAGDTAIDRLQVLAMDQIRDLMLFIREQDGIENATVAEVSIRDAKDEQSVRFSFRLDEEGEYIRVKLHDHEIYDPRDLEISRRPVILEKTSGDGKELQSYEPDTG
jgi:DNA-binding transcriptional MerR regulator